MLAAMDPVSTCRYGFFTAAKSRLLSGIPVTVIWVSDRGRRRRRIFEKSLPRVVRIYDNAAKFMKR